MISRPSFQAMAQPVKDRLVSDARARIAAKLALIAGESAPAAPAPKKSLAPAFTVQGEQANEYFGLDSCIGDINGDGLQDIVVGSPGVGTFGDPQRGRVSIWSTSSLGLGTSFSPSQPPPLFLYQAQCPLPVLGTSFFLFMLIEC